jgi:hypothetical protein
MLVDLVINTVQGKEDNFNPEKEGYYYNYATRDTQFRMNRMVLPYHK